MQLASRFASRSPMLRADHPLSDDQIHRVAPSIFAEDKHDSRSARYSYIPTAAVLTELRKEGFQPFMVCQTRVRDEGKRAHTKHMIRLRHASQIDGSTANEIILLNSHDGTSSYQMLAGMFRLWPAVHRRNYVLRRTMSRLRRLSVQTVRLHSGHSSPAVVDTSSWR
jgi:hypothetical protein